MQAPDPRFRIYTTTHTYRRTAVDLLFGRTGVSKGEVAECECRLAEFLGVKHAVCVPQNRVGVYLAVKHFIKPGQDVIMSPYTIADIVNMVILAGGRPVFADVERSTCNISASEVKRLIGPATGAVLVTHLHGLAAAAHEIREVCESHHVPVIEDAAQALGAMQQGCRVGTIGDAGVFSFGMYKNVNGWFGGAVVSRDPGVVEGIRDQLYQHAYQRRSFLFKKIRKGMIIDLLTCPPLFKALTFWIFRYGFLNDIEAINRRVRTELDVSRKVSLPDSYLARFTPFQARLVLPQLASIDRLSDHRIERGLMYHESLADLDQHGLIVPPAPGNREHIYMYYPVQHPDRLGLLKWLMRRGQDVAAQHYRNCAALPWFSEFFRDCPNTQAVSEQLVFLPTYPRYSLDNVRRNIELVREFLLSRHEA